MELARWLAFRIYEQNPYIKPPKAKTPQQYLRFDWEKPDEAEATRIADSVRVTEAQADELNRIFDELHKKREQ